MKVPARCFVCKQSLVILAYGHWHFKCPDNHLAFAVNLSHEVKELRWNLTDGKIPPRAIWNFQKGTCWLVLTKTMSLPWIEPDFSDVDKLLSRFKTLITFS
jgi:hypothetical protein